MNKKIEKINKRWHLFHLIMNKMELNFVNDENLLLWKEENL